jgi:hypothetical protein
MGVAHYLPPQPETTMNTPDTQKPVMSLEDTMTLLRGFTVFSTQEVHALESALHHLEAGKRVECSCDIVNNYAHFALGGAFLGELEDAVKFCPWCGGTLSNPEQKGEQA